MNEQIELAFWVVLALLAVGGTAGVVFWSLAVLVSWTKINLEGAGRKVFVGIHGRSNEIVLRPQPLERELTTYFIDPLVKTQAFVNPDVDETRILVTFSPAGAPASMRQEDQPQVLFRVAWSIPDWVPFYDIPGTSGDHDKMPDSVRYSRDEYGMPGGPLEQVFLTMEQDRRRERHEWAPDRIDVLLPGPAVIAFMNKYTEGEHLVRILESATRFGREVMNGLNVRDLAHLRETEDEETTVTLRLPIRYLRIRQERIDLDFYRIERDYRNMGELQQVLTDVITFAVRVECELYGIYVNTVSPINIILPQRLTRASQERYARRDEVEAMKVFGAQFATEVQRVAGDTPMDPNIAGLTIADSLGGESRPGILAALISLVKQMRS